MAETEKDLGRLISIHPIAPAYLQRAVFIVVLSFMFFLGMMFAFYVRQSVGYFLLASAFLVLYLITMFSWMMQRRTVVKLHEYGFRYKDRTATWDEVENVDGTAISIHDAKPITIPNTIHDRAKIMETIRRNSESNRSESKL